MNESPIIELVLMKPKAAVDEAALLRASDDLMPFLREVGGFIRRELLKTEDNQWVDLVYWNSLAEAQHAANTIMSKPAGQRLATLLDETSITLLHLHQVRTYNSR
ncbi:MAG: antibiotic biosynthesis monooxygenase family protein [Anaerolineae bacterium]